MGDMSQPGHVKILETWLQSYRPQELFDTTGKFRAELADLAPKGESRMSANPHANGGLLLRDLRLPDFRGFAVKVPKPGGVDAEATRIQGAFIRDVIKLNPAIFRIFSPDETSSNRWDSVFEVTSRCSTRKSLPATTTLPPMAALWKNADASINAVGGLRERKPEGARVSSMNLSTRDKHSPRSRLRLTRYSMFFRSFAYSQVMP